MENDRKKKEEIEKRKKDELDDEWWIWRDIELEE